MLEQKRYRELQETNLLNLLKAGAFQFIDVATPWFPYTSGQVGPYYVQSIAIEKDGAAYAAAIRSMLEIIRAEFPACDAISGGETRDWDFSNPVAVALEKPHVKIYKDGKTLGADIAGKAILHVADLNNEGSSLRDCWKPVIEKQGGRLIGFMAFVDRLEEGTEVIRELGLKAASVVPLDARAWDLARQAGFLPGAAHAALTERLRDRRAWAVRTLLDHPAHFQTLYGNPATNARALKIIRTYPEIETELKRMVKA